MKFISSGRCSFSFFLMLTFVVGVLFSGCSKEEQEVVEAVPVEDPQPENRTHHWYYFTREGFEEIQLPRLAPKPAVKPWTEAARISSSAATDTQSFFTANRRGILIVDADGTITLKTDTRFFPENTIGSLFLDEGNPVFHVYRNTVFNKEEKFHDVAMPFIAEYNLTTNMFYPVLYRDDFGMSDTQEVSSISVNSNTLFLSIKDSDRKTTFDYYRVIIPSTYTETASSAHVRTIDGTPVSQDEYLAASGPAPFATAPERLKALLEAIPSSTKFSISLQATGSESTPVTYLHGFTADTLDEVITDAYAMTGSSWIAALFPDGTVYFQGSLPEQYMVADGKPVCFSLPELPDGFIWTVFAISGNIMTAGWEEAGIYKTGTAGFITVDVSKVLY